MNLVERTIRRIDSTQQRFTPTAFVFGVIKKYGDDNGGVLVSNLAYSSFISIFPLLLILLTILGQIAASFSPRSHSSRDCSRDSPPASRRLTTLASSSRACS